MTTGGLEGPATGARCSPEDGTGRLLRAQSARSPSEELPCTVRPLKVPDRRAGLGISVSVSGSLSSVWRSLGRLAGPSGPPVVMR
jgi:hypothetical protein